MLTRTIRFRHRVTGTCEVSPRPTFGGVLADVSALDFQSVLIGSLFKCLGNGSRKDIECTILDMLVLGWHSG